MEFEIERRELSDAMKFRTHIDIDHLIGKIISFALHHFDGQKLRKIFRFISVYYRKYEIYHSAIINNAKLLSSKHYSIFSEIYVGTIDKIIPLLDDLSNEAIDYMKDRFYASFYSHSLEILAIRFPEKFFRQPFDRKFLHRMRIDSYMIEILETQKIDVGEFKMIETD